MHARLVVVNVAHLSRYDRHCAVHCGWVQIRGRVATCRVIRRVIGPETRHALERFALYTHFMSKIAHRLRWALALALLVQATVPSGFMPSAGHWVELCTVDGVAHVWTTHGNSEPSTPEQSTPTCPWVGVVPMDVVLVPWNTGLLRLHHDAPEPAISANSFSANRWARPAPRAPPIVS